MSFGRRLPNAEVNRAGRRGLLVWGAAFALLTLLLAGCGGGGNRNTNPGPNPNDPTVTGRVVELYSGNAALVGATVALRRTNGQTLATGQTDSTGAFSLRVSPTTENTRLFITSPAGKPVYDQATRQVSGQPAVGFALSAGIQVGPLATQTNTNIGTVVVASQDGPPPPPQF